MIFFRSRKCLDLEGNQIIFTVKKDSDKITFLWKALIKIACVKVNPNTRKILNIKIISLKDFIHLSNTMSTNLEAIRNSEEKQRSNSSSPSSVSSFVCPYPSLFNFDVASSSSTEDEVEECCICLDRKTEVILSCLHSFCSPCIETWNESNPSCPLCMERMLNTDDSWVPVEHPEANEISEEIINQLTKFSERN